MRPKRQVGLTRAERAMTKRIAAKVGSSMPELDPHLHAWARAHLVEPRRIELFMQDRGTRLFWLVTDHVGSDDANCRVVYDPHLDRFGLEFTLVLEAVEVSPGAYRQTRYPAGRSDFLGVYDSGSFADAVKAL